MIPETKPKFKVSHCRHGAREYSLGIQADNLHVDLHTHSYGHRPGSDITVDWYGLTPDDITALGCLLITKGAELSNKEAATDTNPCLDASGLATVPPTQEPA